MFFIAVCLVVRIIYVSGFICLILRLNRYKQILLGAQSTCSVLNVLSRKNSRNFVETNTEIVCSLNNKNNTDSMMNVKIRSIAHE